MRARRKQRLWMEFNENVRWIRSTWNSSYETLTFPLYDTADFRDGLTTRLEFFTQLRTTRSESNLWTPGYLPDPCAFMIKRIRLLGITTALQFGAFELHIGNKVYGDWPAWTLAVREKAFESIPLLIPPMQHFMARLEWPQPISQPESYAQWNMARPWPIQCVLFGDYARPIQ